jgi:hypothetical protein
MPNKEIERETKMKSLGKIIILTFILYTSLYAGVRAELTRDSVSIGDTVILRLHVSGDKIQEPAISKLCGVKVLSTAHSTNMVIDNGRYTKKQMFSYSFTPTHSCTIEPITVNIDGVDEQTQPLKLRVSQMTITKDTPFVVTMQTKKDSVYIGEPIRLIVKIKQKNSAQAVDSKFAQPELKNFWIKGQEEPKRYQEGSYSVTEIVYVIAAQKSGKLHIGRAQLQIAQRVHSRDAWGSFFPQLQWRSFFGNELDIDVKELPKGVDIVGDFKISASLDKLEAAPNDAINLTLKISGSGNFEDIGSLKPFVDGVNIFEEDATINAQIVNGEYVGVWQQKMAFVSEHDYTIPPIELKYFNPKTKNIVTIATKALHVKIKGRAKAKEKPLKIERSEKQNEIVNVEMREQNSQPSYLWIISLIGGIILGVLLMLIPWKRFKKEDDNLNSVNIRDEKSVLNFLLNHIEDEEAFGMLKLLEAKLYEGKTVNIDKKQLKELVKRLHVK